MVSEFLIRLLIFLCLFIIFATLEIWIPRRTLAQSRGRRWTTNFGLTILNTISLRIMAFALPLLAIGAAIDASQSGWGLLNKLSLPAFLEIILVIMIFDFAIWFQHLMTHKIPILWQLHSVHHADRDFDVTTALRFHPLEIALSMLAKIGLVYAVGPSALAVLLFEIILNGTAMFNHSNIKLPNSIDWILRMFLVTPDMHRVHHSVHRAEHDSNYGFSLSVWDRAFGTYVSQPSDGHSNMLIGLECQDDRPSRLVWSLIMPFRHK
ncbi:sterol desaturase family protein [Pseudopelagicola sp. nBUS_19]|uniref:sterol desaturase family protein n=1 Tax=Pseudopelagicola sp. nBUS_19 TaxID=3395316 RepID=UPI003EBFC18F